MMVVFEVVWEHRGDKAAAEGVRFTTQFLHPVVVVVTVVTVVVTVVAVVVVATVAVLLVQP